MFILTNVAKSAKKYSFGAIINRFSTIAAKNVSPSTDKRSVIVDFEKIDNDQCKKERLKFPLMWLRDNCQCSSCFHGSSKSRAIDWARFKLDDAQLKSISLDKNLQITWADKHISNFEIDWLYKRNFSFENRCKYLESIYRPKVKLWPKDEFSMKTFEAANVLETNGGLRKWIETLCTYGVALIKNVSLNEDQVRKLANRIGFIRKTQYGEEFTIRAVPNAKNYAYTSNSLQLHTDLPYYEYKPGITLLHCIKQTKSAGALSLLADGFHAAETLRRINPKAFECLTTTLVNWSDYGDDNGTDFEKIFRSPVICLDYDGTIKRINQSVPQRDSFFSIDSDKVDEWYAAMRAFVDLLYANTVQFKLEPGDMLAFSNVRLLHGRTGYVDTDGDVRHLIGAYIDWDEIYSRLRVLASVEQP